MAVERKNVWAPDSTSVPQIKNENMEQGLKKSCLVAECTLSSRNKPTGPKNALMRLNDIKPGLRFTVSDQTGPAHAPTFEMSVKVNGILCKGSASTKKKAKHLAAEKALALLQPDTTLFLEGKNPEHPIPTKARYFFHYC